MQNITKTDLVNLRAQVAAADEACTQWNSTDLTGKSAAEMVDFELHSLRLAYARDAALKAYQEAMRQFVTAEMSAPRKAQLAPAPNDVVIEEQEQGRERLGREKL